MHRTKDGDENSETNTGASKSSINDFVLRKSRSSGTLPSGAVPKNGAHHVFVNPAANTSLHSLNSNNDYDKKASISSITFSRVR